MAGTYKTIVENDKKFREASTKTMGDYEKEAAAKKAEKDYDKAGGPLVKKAKGGKVKCMARGGGIEVRGKTKGRMV